MKHSNHAQHYTPEPVSPFEHEAPDLYDVLSFVCLAVCLIAAALSYFDVLVK